MFRLKRQDGDNTKYYIGTQGYNKLSPAGTYMNSIAIFNRINGNISVSNNSVEKGNAFILSGWDALATFNEKDLTWSVNGKTLSDLRCFFFGVFVRKIFVNNQSKLRICFRRYGRRR
ncbi:hypothetical protein [Anaerocaecibacter muris]|uniref:hypothetical protein n=1 Tax=Anaerocaecibacter muris TaxID=2941513 RepID=UPI0020425CD1|nr:hypothetical protein [Anaerocaecibacter muris]